MMMDSPFILAKWALRIGAVACFGVDGMVVEAAAESIALLAKDLWEKHMAKCTPEERCRIIEELAQAEVFDVMAEVRDELDAIPDPATRRAAEAYVAALPGQLRASLRRAADPSGRTVSAAQVPQDAADLQRLLPSRLPRFRKGDRPGGIGDWELEELLGTGGFGEVWKARNPHMSNETVALKFCLDAKAASSLQREAALLNRVKGLAGQQAGGGIVKIMGTAFMAEPPCIIYEFVEGGTLAGLIHERKTFQPEEAARLILELAETMSVCQSLPNPIVHRDLKPANILVEARTGRLRITDFGIGGIGAPQAGGSHVHQFSHSNASGSYTALYASPQQIRGCSADVRDDVYALGIVWWQLLCGDMGQGAPSGRWMQKLTAAGHPAGLVELLADCLEADATQRLAHGGDLAEGMRKTLKGESTVIGVPSTPAAVTPPPLRSHPSVPATAPKRDLTIAGLTRKSVFETQEGYAASLAAMGWVVAGNFAFGEDDYDGEIFRLPQNIAWAEFVQASQRPYGDLALPADQPLAVQAFAHGANQSLYTQLSASGKTYTLHDFTILINGQHYPLVDLVREASLGTVKEILAVMVAIKPGSVKPKSGGEVKVDQPYSICQYPITQKWYEAVIGTNPSHFKEPQRPVEQVSWDNAQAFCEKLNEVAGSLAGGMRFALPSEAQWEFACRAGSTGEFGLLKSGKEGTVDQMAWYAGNSGNQTHPVGQGKESNTFGLYDMHGNVWEWCEDWYNGEGRVMRGGGWSFAAGLCRAASRYGINPGNRNYDIGFRPVLTTQNK